MALGTWTLLGQHDILFAFIAVSIINFFFFFVSWEIYGSADRVGRFNSAHITEKQTGQLPGRIFLPPQNEKPPEHTQRAEVAEWPTERLKHAEYAEWSAPTPSLL